MGFYYFDLIGTAVFAITGVLVVTRRGLDVVGALVLGVVTAIGGGTVRDVIIGAPIFWVNDVNYLWAAIGGALAAFWVGPLFRSAYRGLLYLDGLGGALFAVAAANKVLLLHMGGPVAVMMGLLTGIGGGLIRDVLAGRPTLLMSREVYATPILLGCMFFVALRTFAPDFAWPGVTSSALIFLIRAIVIYRHMEMPTWLTLRHHEGV